MALKKALCLIALFAISTCAQQAKPANTVSSSEQQTEPGLPYTPSLDPTAMDRTADPCVDFYEYSCGGWKKMNPIPSDQTSWSVYGKLYEDNLNYSARHSRSKPPLPRTATRSPRKSATTTQSCMDETEIEKLGAQPLQPDLTAIHNLNSTKDLAALIATLHFEGIAALFQRRLDPGPRQF